MSDCPLVSKRLEQGVLIALEGIDGAGKTTQASRLAELLVQTGHEVVRTKEPTDGTWGRKLRESAKSGRLAPEEELRFFINDRKEHVERRIKPELAAGKIVIIDRYYFSTVAYQGARGMDPAKLLAMNEAFAPRPDLLVLLEIPPEEALRRIQERGDVGNLFEEESSLRAVAKEFAAMDFPYLMRVDGTEPAEKVSIKLLDRLYSGLLSTREPATTAGRLPKGKDESSNDDLWSAVARVAREKPQS